MRRKGARWKLLLVASIASMAYAGGEDPGFMPKGGRALLIEMTASDTALLRDIAASRRSDDEWRVFIDARNTKLTERERATLAAYLSVNFPAPSAVTTKDVVAALPSDGRDLAWTECQSCHSLFAGYLTHTRDAQGWRNIFLSPFHRQMKMDAREREEFARYSALNMPMKRDDIPEELRF